MYDPAGRFQVVEEPAFAPGSDYITKSSVGPFIDTGVFIGVGSGRERLYLAKDTILDMANQLGLLEEVLEAGDKRYHEGYNDAVRENLSGDLRDIADRLGAVVPYLSGLAGDPSPVESETPEAPVAAGGALDAEDGRAEPFVVDSVESIADRSHAARGQSDGSRGDQRPAELPAGSSDDALYRI